MLSHSPRRRGKSWTETQIPSNVVGQSCWTTLQLNERKQQQKILNENKKLQQQV